MANSVYVFRNGIMVDLHYLVAIRPEETTSWLHLSYQLSPKTVDICIGNSAGHFDREEYEMDLASFGVAWRIYKNEQKR